VFCLNVSISFGQLNLIEQSKNKLVFSLDQKGHFKIVAKGIDSEFHYEDSLMTSIRSNFTLKDLDPASLYSISIYKDHEAIESGIYVTESNSSGEIKHYFNHSILDGKTGDIEPNGTTFSECEKAIRDLINGAKKTIDYCAYNTNVASIVNALIDASNRGVRVRVIADNSTSNTALKGSLPFEVSYDNSGGLMHNKFIVVDESIEQSAWLVTGSMNFTTTQMKTDPNHLIFIQDQSLSKAYTIEFEEMWGSNNEMPNKNIAKFGGAKKDNTPHEFTINGIKIESYFSPSDNTSSKIINVIKKANETIDLGLLIFTYNEIKDNLIDRLNEGVAIRGIIDDTDDSFENITAINNNGGNIINDPSSSIFHYKMGVFDAGLKNSDPTVITGSHNWTFSAETRNDENILIIHDQKITDLYSRALGFFFQKWLTDIEEIYREVFVFPNPASDFLFIKNGEYKSILIRDINGRIILKEEDKHSQTIDISSFNKGLYTIEIDLQHEKIFTKFIKL
jgi:phosphatidylserine/phosphatidylglycerophosphate/cardiolipin synthase-like enzyme